MASKKLMRARSGMTEQMKMDMSPMIDMVFLLLIFFMIASNMITIKMDPKVLPPVADQSKKPPNVKGRFIVNIYEDGSFKDVNWNPISEEQITQRIRVLSDGMKNTGRVAKLHIRADRLAPVLSVKKVTKAAGQGGVNALIFSSYVTALGDPKRK